MKTVVFPHRMWLLLGIVALIPVNLYGTHAHNLGIALGAICGQVVFYGTYQALKHRAKYQPRVEENEHGNK